jgi:hypothetical protein
MARRKAPLVVALIPRALVIRLRVPRRSMGALPLKGHRPVAEVLPRDRGRRPGHGRGQALLAPATLGIAQQAQEEASSEPASPNDAELTDEEEQVVAKLKQTDAETKRHEQAHAAAGGQYERSPSYSYQTGPDGKQYAIGGEGSIDVSPIDGDPDATIRMMQQVKAAALAPAEPSSGDRGVASQADANIASARAELSAQTAETLSGEDGEDGESGQAEEAAQGAQPTGGEGRPVELPGRDDEDGGFQAANNAQERAPTNQRGFAAFGQAGGAASSNAFTRPNVDPARIVNIAV